MLEGPPPPLPKFATLTEMLEAAAQSDSGFTFWDLNERETFLPFAGLWGRARRMAAALLELGVRAGDRVALIFPTCPELVEAFFATVLAGAVPVPLYPPLRLGRLDEYHRTTAAMLRAVGARLLLASGRVKRFLGQTVLASRLELGCRSVEELPGGASPPPLEAVDPRSLAFIQFSSGTTANPKPVALTHEDLLAQCAVLRSFLPEERGHPQRGVSWLPLYHDMGLIGFLLGALYYPGPLTLISPEAFLAKPILWLRAISKHRATISAAPNFGYGLCLTRIRDADLEGLDLSSWRLALNGAETVSPTLIRQFEHRFGPYGFDARALRPVYGLAEATLAVTFTPARSEIKTHSVDPEALSLSEELREGAREVASVGSPIPGVRVDIRGPNGESLGPGRLGKIHVIGPSVMQGYFGQPDASQAVLRERWLDTGDLGFVFEGELYISGRAKDVIIIRGANHAPQEFEEWASRVPGVRVGCVVALPLMPKTGDEAEQLLLLAERAKEGAGGHRAPVRQAKGTEAPPDLAEEICRTVALHTGIRPHTVELLAPGTLPRTSSGKLRRAEALKRYVAGTLRAPRLVNAATLAAERLKSALALMRAERP
jgi:acyl-CoA synthetase (AMP-forming)/AMP-acid ligase II